MVESTGIYERGIYRAGEVRISDLSGRRRLPVGNDDFLSVVENSVFIDKTMLIADVLDSGATATLFCRPRRFGKSLNLSMIQRFLEIPSPDDPVGRDTTELFVGLAIWDADGGAYRAHHGAYPVISLSLKTAKTENADTFVQVLGQIVAAEYERHRYVATGGTLSGEQRAFFDRIAAGAASEAELTSSLEWLCRALTKHHGRRCVILIDEYDAPVASSFASDAYRGIVEVLKRWLTGALKGNPTLEFAVLTGVQRISKESIFSDLNNLVVNTPLNLASEERYGFVAAEVSVLCAYLGADARSFEELREWYDGYCFGRVDVYNPWSVLNYFLNHRTAGVYWANASSNAPVASLIAAASPRLLGKVYRLLEPGGTVLAPLDLAVVFGEATARGEAFWSLLYLSGYLTTRDTEDPNSTVRVRALEIPNLEVAQVFRSEVVERFVSLAGSREALSDFQESLVEGDAALLAAELESVLLNSASYYDLTSENSYHMLLVGLLFGMAGYGNPVSNREAGRGRFDIRLDPEREGLPAIILELKCERDVDEARLEALADEALAQISARAYDADCSEDVLRYGIAFSGKQVVVAV